MVFVRHAHGRQSPVVFDRVVERDAIVSTGSDVVWPISDMLRTKYFASAFLYSLPHCGRSGGSPPNANEMGSSGSAR